MGATPLSFAKVGLAAGSGWLLVRHNTFLRRFGVISPGRRLTLDFIVLESTFANRPALAVLVLDSIEGKYKFQKLVTALQNSPEAGRKLA